MNGHDFRRNPTRQAEQKKLIGLAFSGGGIRSATLNLGILQALADQDILRHVDYLSTVSGGGFIGSWLTAWSARREGGVRTVQERIAPSRSANPDADEVRPLRFLREYSNYLTPRKGLLSPDTWTLVAVWFRNTLLNLCVIVPLLFALVLGPRAILLAFTGADRHQTYFVVAALSLALGAFAIGRNLRQFNRDQREERKTAWFSNSGVLWTVVLPLAVSAIFAAVAFRNVHESIAVVFAATSISLFIGFCIVHIKGKSWTESKRNPIVFVGWLILSAALSSVAGGGLMVLVWRRLNQDLGPVLAFGPPLLLTVFGLAVMLETGLLGIEFPDARREWWSRLAAWFAICASGWASLFAIAFYGPDVVSWLLSHWSRGSPAVLAWLGTTGLGIFWGQSNVTPSPAEEGRKPRGARDKFIEIAPYVFIVGLFLGLSWVARQLFPLPTSISLWLWILLWAAVGTFMGRRVNINEFSMHQFYRNRLVRCYLGASRRTGERKENPFTGFDPSDDFPLSNLRWDNFLTHPANGNGTHRYVGPYPIINTALNLVKGDDLAAQERKATSFIFGPCYSGYEHVNRQSGCTLDEAREGYRMTDVYAYPANDGVSVGTAVAISGAAANPNMGCHSSPAVAFLMTLFNVRLGWWLGNSRRDDFWEESSPRSGLAYLVKELTSNTDDKSAFVNLSDGGHFENLGIYELVRRHCRYIIACDGEQDESLGFGGLGNAIRKCRTDFGVDIDIVLNQIRRVSGKTPGKAHCVVGEIRYPSGARGKLVYLKASLTGDEPSDVLEYAARERGFPHQSTADQWFDESQFESYRELGYHIGGLTFGRAAKGRSLPNGRGAMFEYLQQLWTASTAAIDKNSTKHSRSYSALVERVRKSAPNGQVNNILYPALGGAVMAGAFTRDDVYLCISLIQLMQDVFMDLDLENQSQHPHNQGWMQMFQGWAVNTAFIAAWNVCSGTYPLRFRQFCAAEFGLP